MKHAVRFVLAFGVLVAAVPTRIAAHFRLVEPASWLIESDRGDPQKAGPCGGTNTDYGKPSYVISKATGGRQLHIKVQETIYHPGHYRVALTVNSHTELPLDPEIATADTPNSPKSVSAKIQDPPHMPVLADGLWIHTANVDVPWERTFGCPILPARGARSRSRSS